MNSANCAELPRVSATEGVGIVTVFPTQSPIPVIRRSGITEVGSALMTRWAANSGTPGDGFICCLPPDWFDVDIGDV
jgi:hypothetical protein